MNSDYKNIERALKDGRKIHIEIDFVEIDDELMVGVDFNVTENIDGKEKIISSYVVANTFCDALKIIEARLE